MKCENKFKINNKIFYQKFMEDLSQFFEKSPKCKDFGKFLKNYLKALIY